MTAFLLGFAFGLAVALLIRKLRRRRPPTRTVLFQ